MEKDGILECGDPDPECSRAQYVIYSAVAAIIVVVVLYLA